MKTGFIALFAIMCVGMASAGPLRDRAHNKAKEVAAMFDPDDPFDGIKPDAITACPNQGGCTSEEFCAGIITNGLITSAACFTSKQELLDVKIEGAANGDAVTFRCVGVDAADILCM